MTISFNLSGKAALVTGANTGIGQAIALALAQAVGQMERRVRTLLKEGVE